MFCTDGDMGKYLLEGGGDCGAAAEWLEWGRRGRHLLCCGGGTFFFA